MPPCGGTVLARLPQRPPESRCKHRPAGVSRRRRVFAGKALSQKPPAQKASPVRGGAASGGGGVHCRLAAELSLRGCRSARQRAAASIAPQAFPAAGAFLRGKPFLKSHPLKKPPLQGEVPPPAAEGCIAALRRNCPCMAAATPARKLPQASPRRRFPPPARFLRGKPFPKRQTLKKPPLQGEVPPPAAEGCIAALRRNYPCTAAAAPARKPPQTSPRRRFPPPARFCGGKPFPAPKRLPEKILIPNA